MNGHYELADQHLEEARHYAAMNQRGERLHYCNLAVRAAPHYTIAWIERGNARMELGDPQGALSDFEQALLIEPENAQALYGRAWAKQYLHDYDGAIEDAKHAYHIDPSTEVLYYRRVGSAYGGKGDKARELEYYNRALVKAPNNPGTRFNRAVYFNEQGHYQAALNDLNYLITTQPTWSWALRERGYAFLKLGDYKTAVRDLSQAIQFEPTDVALYRLRAEAYRKLSLHEQANRDLHIAQQFEADVSN